MLIRARKEASERGLVAHVARHDANILRKLPRQRIAVHDQRPNFRLRVLQLRQHSASQKARRSRNQIFLKHPITSKNERQMLIIFHTYRIIETDARVNRQCPAA